MMRFVSTVVTVLYLSLGCVPMLAYTGSGNRLYRTDGSAADTQHALESAPEGSIVVIPKGKYVWSSAIAIKRDVSLRGDRETVIVNNYDAGSLIRVESHHPFAVSISGLKFVEGPGLTSRSGVTLEVQKPILLHDAGFETNGKLLRSITWACNGGVIWACNFYSHDEDNGAIAFQNSSGGPQGVSTDWNSPDTFGTQDVDGRKNTYVEDCVFKNIYLQALDFSDNSRTVVRHCRFENSALTSHGLDTGPYGVRQWEVYKNTFVFSTSGASEMGKSYPLPMDYWFFVRGGTGVFWGNSVPDMVSQQWGTKSTLKMTVFNIRRKSAYIPCQTKWPAIHQVGQGYNHGLVLDPVYIWDNTSGRYYNTPGINDWEPDECGKNQHSADYIKAGRDYVVGAAKPGYTEYPYPHLLRRNITSDR